MRGLLDEELVAAGYEVITAADGQAALQHLQRAHVDAVVTDLMMPGLRGQELLVEVRASQPGLPVVVITAFGSIESAVDSMRAGAFHYVPKPFAIDRLLAAIEGAIQQHVTWPCLTQGAPGDRLGGVAIVAESGAMRKSSR